jgi:molybdate transport system substrate-binding protein
VSALAALVVALGCSRGGKTGGGDPNVVEAVVPCGQIGPFSTIAKLWEKQNPTVKLKWRMGNMVTITEEVLSGSSKPDAFLSMGDVEVDRLQKADLLVDGTRTAFADNALVLTVPADNPAGVNGVADLVKPGVKAIAVPNPEKNSVGKHAIEALEGAGVWKQIEGKVISTTYAADSKEMGEKGQTDASVDYYPCVSEVHIPGQPPVEPKGLKVMMIPAKLYKPFSCEAAVVKGSGNPEAGKKLIALLKSPEAQKLFTQWNFRRDLSAAHR